MQQVQQMQPIPAQQMYPIQQPYNPQVVQIPPYTAVMGQNQQVLPPNMPIELPIQIKDLKKNILGDRNPFFEITAPENICSFPFINKQEFESDVQKFLTEVAKPIMKKFKCLLAMYIPLIVSVIIWCVLTVVLFFFGGVPGFVSIAIAAVCYGIICIALMVVNIDIIRTFKRVASDKNLDYHRKYETQFNHYGYETQLKMGVFKFANLKIRKITNK